MSLNVSARRIVSTARSTSISKPSLHLNYLLPRDQRRHAWNDPKSWFGLGQRQHQQDPNSGLTKELDKREKQMKMMNRLTNRDQGGIFDEEIKQSQEEVKDDDEETKMMRQLEIGPSKLNEHMQRAVDPDPRWRIRYTKKKIMKMMRSDKEPTKAELIRRSERELSSQSAPLPTSTKKLVHLSHQIAGKTVEDAIVQMRFSKKKMATEVRYQLEEARAEAIAARGMALGARNGEVFARPKKIQTKDGQWIEVTDPTRLYVDQAWVNKGPWRGARIRYGARARMSVKWSPTARIAVVLKEEKTRIRQYEDKVEKKAKAKPWVHLPNKPVYHQRPYYSW